MDLHLFSVPYDTARRGERMGAGPERLLRSGAGERLRATGHRVRVEEVTPPPDGAFAGEISTAFALQRAVAAAVQRAVADGRFPIVLAGNCNAAAIGTLAGIGARDVGVLWFDSHGDFNTPETTTGGFLDGMALAIATGRCWRQLAAQVPGFVPVDEGSVVLLGTRDLDPLEACALAESRVTVLSPDDVRAELASVLGRLRARVRDVYIHLDLDVLDPDTDGRANALAAPDGLTLDEILSALRLIGGRFRIRGAGVTAYDPAYDADGRVAAAALALLQAIVEAATTTPSPKEEE
jgi:arginase